MIENLTLTHLCRLGGLYVPDETSPGAAIVERLRDEVVALDPAEITDRDDVIEDLLDAVTMTTASYRWLAMADLWAWEALSEADLANEAAQALLTREPWLVADLLLRHTLRPLAEQLLDQILGVAEVAL